MAKKEKKASRNGSADRQFPIQGKVAGAVMALVLAVTGALTAVVYPYWYQGMTYPGVMIGGMPVGGLSRVELQRAVEQMLDEYRRRGVVLKGFGSSVVLYPAVSALGDLDLSYDLVSFDAETMVQRAMAAGRDTRFPSFTNSISPHRFRNDPLNIPLEGTLQEERIGEFVRQEFAAHERSARDASFIVVADNALTVVPEQAGETINVEEVFDGLRQAVRQRSHGPVLVKSVMAYPRIREAEVRPLLASAQAVIARAPFSVYADPGSFPESYPQEEIKKKESNEQVIWRKELAGSALSPWFTVVKEDGVPPRLGFSPEAVTSFLAGFHDSFDIPAHDARFTVQDGKVVEFQSSQDGMQVDDAASRALFEKEFLEYGASSAPVMFGVAQASVRTDAANSLGIRERLGIGTSNFAGSPKNRRHNIAVGAAAVNGMLIPPGEEFSLLKTLGEVDGENGYLPELVIKGNRTIPEFGGGLCQIGTTAFRAAIATGMPITERRNHSYRVQYYEPAGTDATIYSPSPDFKFLNDTGSYLLFQARIEGDSAVFELWGTSDGRVATSTKPVIYNIVPPPPTKLIKTTELKPGEKKCTERPHNGADASFTYRVAYPGGETKEQVFKSHYRPWQEVCLVGATKEEIDAESAKPSDAPVAPPGSSIDVSGSAGN